MKSTQKTMTMPPVLQSDIEEIILIKRSADVVYAQVRAKSLASEIGFAKSEQWEIGIAVSEAATNILKFAGDGKIFLRRINEEFSGLEFEASDKGPGIPDIESALKDGFSEGKEIDEDFQFYERRGLGFGLAAIKRMMDSLDIDSSEDRGTSLIARKFLTDGKT